MAEQVLYVSPGGKDGAAGTARAPLKSVEQALRKARPGATIVLKPGEYPPIVLQGLCGTAGRPIVLRGQKRAPIDFRPVAALRRNIFVKAIRAAMDAGKFALKSTKGLAVVAARGSDVGLTVHDCEHLRIEDLVVRDARTNMHVQRCRHVTFRGGVLFGDPAVSVAGAIVHRTDMDEPPSEFLRFERMLAYGMKQTGFGVHPAGAFDCTWECCIAHSMQSTGGDGFSFSHVSVTDKPNQSPCRVFADGIDYRFRLTRCAALRNRLDGFDIGNGVGGVTLEYCLGDGNGWGAYFAKDIKVWSSNNTLRICRMTGRILFVNGTNTLEDFKTGAEEDRL